MLSYGSGDADAFDMLYQRHKGALYRFVLRQCGQAYVDELFQDIWLKVINARKTYRVSASFRTWLYHMARNRIIGHYRRQNIRPAGSHIKEPDTIAANPGEQPDNQLHANSQYEKLLQAIAELPSEQKEAFLLREEAGLSIEEIAVTCGVNFETAKSRLRYALNKLRDKIGDEA